MHVRGCTLALKPRVDLYPTKSKTGVETGVEIYKWPHNKDMCIPNFKIKILEELSTDWKKYRLINLCEMSDQLKPE